MEPSAASGVINFENRNAVFIPAYFVSRIARSWGLLRIIRHFASARIRLAECVTSGIRTKRLSLLSRLSLKTALVLLNLC